MGRNRNYSLGLYEKAIPSGFTFSEMLKITLNCGFDRLEISIDESDFRLSRLNWSSSERRSVLNQCSDNGLNIGTMCLSGHRKYPMGSHDCGIREKSLDIMKKAIDLSYDLGVRIIQLAGYDVYYEQGDPDTEKWFWENLHKAVEYASQSGVVLAFETMETPFMDTVGKAMKWIEKIQSPFLCIYPDIGNLQNASVKYHEDTISDLEKGAGHIVALHLKETLPGVYRDMKFGTTGHTRYDDCIRFAAQHNIRMFTGEFWFKEGTDYLREIIAASTFLREKLDKVFLTE